MNTENNKTTRFLELVKKINENSSLIPDLMKSEKGNNFRAISESAILEAINPILIEEHWFYVIEVCEHHLEIKEAIGTKGRKLQFIATVRVMLRFINDEGNSITTEAVGMGIDDNDKAMGKAYTYAVKYALLKVFRLRYGDDPDFKASEPLYLDKSKEISKKEEIQDKKQKNDKRADTSSKELPMTEKQRDYILGLMKEKNVSSEEVENRFGYNPKIDDYIPMPIARKMIQALEDDEFLPF